MPTTIGVDTFDGIVKSYRADVSHQNWEQQSIERRKIHIARFTEIARQFADGKISLKIFCDALTAAFKATGESWSARGHGFMSPMYKFSKSHGLAAHNYLQKLLTDLTAENMGVKIELFYNFLKDERARLRHEGIHWGSIAEAGKSATIISLFAFWLHPEQEPIVYHEETRKGLAWLISKGLFVPSQAPHIIGESAVVYTNHDHQLFQGAASELLFHHPEIKSSPYWPEFFFGWVGSRKPIAFPPSDPPIDPPDDKLLFLKNEKLLPTQEPLLSSLIREVQRYVLVEESIIRRIYHALLAGHIVLSGPPGTGKTELARLIPETLWKSAKIEPEAEDNEDTLLGSETAYTTRLVTATDEWSVRTLISGIIPVTNDGHVTYEIQDGHLTATIKKNWLLQSENAGGWHSARRIPVKSSSNFESGTQQTFRGQWLVIDEFNRAPIDLALGEALTALGGKDVLRVMTENGSMELPIPKDFRVIGTLNSFDRNYLNQISEALKRRFSFIEILPPGRNLREAEQAMVLHKALDQVSHLRQANNPQDEIFPWDTLAVEADLEGPYIITWPDEPHPFREAFEVAWHVFETIRVYRQLGTAQAIGLVRHMLIAGILQGYTTREQWIGEALDAALCDTIADQLQVLLPDEIETLLLALTSERAAFSAAYHRLLANLADRQQRLYGQLLALGRVSDEHGVAYLSDEEIEASAQSSPPTVAEAKLRAVFHLDAPLYRLPQFTRRLRAFKAERGL